MSILEADTSQHQVAYRISIEMAAFQYCFLLKKRPFQSKFAVFSRRLSRAGPYRHISCLRKELIVSTKTAWSIIKTA